MLSTITIGTATDSWGAWFSSDPEQLPADQFLRSMASAESSAVEFKPGGQLCNDSTDLQEQPDAHGLSPLAGAVFTHLYQADPGDCRRPPVADVAALSNAAGGDHIVITAESWPDHKCAPEIPLPIAKRTNAYLNSCSARTSTWGLLFHD